MTSKIITVPNSFLGATLFRMHQNFKALSLSQKITILGTSILLTGAAISGFLNAATITTNVAHGITAACTAIKTFCTGLNLASAATIFKYVTIGLGVLGLLLFTIVFFKKPIVQKNFEKLVHEKATQLVLADFVSGVKTKTEQVKSKTKEIIAKGKNAGQAVCNGVKNSVETLSQTAIQAKQELVSLASKI